MDFDPRDNDDASMTSAGATSATTANGTWAAFARRQGTPVTTAWNTCARKA